jgi:hypothetical protein
VSLQFKNSNAKQQSGQKCLQNRLVLTAFALLISNKRWNVSKNVTVDIIHQLKTFAQKTEG